MTADDFLAYDVHFKKPVLTSLPGRNLTFVSMRPPSSGALIPFILNVMNGGFIYVLFQQFYTHIT